MPVAAQVARSLTIQATGAYASRENYLIGSPLMAPVRAGGATAHARLPCMHASQYAQQVLNLDKGTYADLACSLHGCNPAG